ncbi:hypothetical protein GCM10010094_34910 [Streptomyces flaveus]|uniref:Uncharacterized protein n=1 Tax=Streptomyces flaveus TaxID=66370 RepID=A0A917QW63_9ACTN|nr:hypothetical protein GCM10010094_34910 [Streptomyces flaveus]
MGERPARCFGVAHQQVGRASHPDVFFATFFTRLPWAMAGLSASRLDSAFYEDFKRVCVNYGGGTVQS